MIAISGFTSENDDHHKEWKNLTENYPHLSVYAYCWKASTNFNLFPDAKTLTLAVTLLMMSNWTAAAITPFALILGVRDLKNDFHKIIRNAKVAGKLLAYSLMIQFPFKNQSISLVGFSLGTQVIKSCLKELYKHKAYNIINNVYLMGGAVNSSNFDTWSEILNVVRGTVFNGYSKSDKILHLYALSTSKNSIGRNPLLDLENSELKEEVDKEKSTLFENYKTSGRVKNFDVTNEAGGHRNYRDNLKKVLIKMNFYG